MSNSDKEFLQVKISPDHLQAQVFCTEHYEENKSKVNKYYVDKLLEKYNITYGIDDDAIQTLLSHPSPNSFPITIARGRSPEKGEDGKIVYKINVNSMIEQNEDWNFRDVMKIPSVREGDEIAEIIPPTDGIDGKGVNDYLIKARPGKPFLMRPGKNVEYNEEDRILYASQDGQVVIRENRVSVEPVYEVHGDLSLEVGNIKFVGNVNIYGDVPTGFSIEAGGDVNIHGLVEAATITSGGSIFIYEGFAGLQKGVLKAEQDIHVGYMNQGKAEAKNSIFVENSILHSECIAGKDVFCQRGNIIGGTISLGRTIEARDIGNRLNIRTDIQLKIDEKKIEEEQKLLAKRKELNKTLQNLSLIKEKLLSQETKTDQIKELIIRQENSYNKTKAELEATDRLLNKLKEESTERAALYVQNTLYPNTAISFGKYQRLIQKEFDKVQVTFEEKEIKIQPYNV